MKLQLALDTVDIEGALSLLQELDDLLDIVEAGTPFVFREGMAAVSEIKRVHPSILVLADLKIMDAGQYEAGIAFEAGADIVTVLAVAHDATIEGVVREARSRGKQTMADLIATPNAAARAAGLDEMGIDYVCVHTATDLQVAGNDPLAEMKAVQPVLQRTGMAVAGGVSPELMRQIAPYAPDIVVVGSYITGHANPREAAEAIREQVI